MNNSLKVRHVYAELRATLGKTMPEHELLECASLIIEACDNPLKDVCYFHDGKTPLCELPVHQVIGTWPWELVDSEFKSLTHHDFDIQDDYMAHVPIEIQWQELLSA
jgi:hypothetical protein|tara:strand:+ start:85 stop:405 length:321 start_codon:yes stop_codon:yes gene_type:complete